MGEGAEIVPETTVGRGNRTGFKDKGDPVGKCCLF